MSPASVTRLRRPIGSVSPPRARARAKVVRFPAVVPLLAGLWLCTIVVGTVFADVLPIPQPDVAVGQSATAPLSEGGSLVLGTDRLGRSELARIIFGARTSLALGACATLIGMMVGGTLGLLAGYFRGLVDTVVVALTNILISLPGLVLLLAIAAVLRPGMGSLLIGLGLIATPVFVRIARASALSYASREFVTAARAQGARHSRILVRELMPNVALPIMSYGFLMVAVLIAAEGSLSYLGVGIPPPAPSWGGMIADGQRDLRTNPFLLFVPAITMFLTVYSLNILGDSARKLLNVREKDR